MSVALQIKCDGCGKIKGETNHWYAINKVENKLVIMPYTENRAKRYPVLCGQECLVKSISEALPSL